MSGMKGESDNIDSHVCWVLKDFHVDSILYSLSLMTTYFDIISEYINLYVFTNWRPIIRIIRKIVLKKV